MDRVKLSFTARLDHAFKDMRCPECKDYRVPKEEEHPSGKVYFCKNGHSWLSNKEHGMYEPYILPSRFDREDPI